MKSLSYIAFTICIILSAVSAYAGPLVYHDGDIIREDTTWSGDVLVDGVLFVPETVTLTIESGTTVRFTKSDAEYRESGVSEAVIPGSGLRVEGRVVAQGTPDKFITFTSSEADPAPGSWGCIFFDHAKGSVFEYCRFEYSAYTVHAHFSTLEISRSVITKNMDGSRLGYSRVEISHCDIKENNGKGLNFANCRNSVRYCNITGNNEGIFLNQKDAACVIEENNIYGNARFDLSMGEFHDEDITTGVNWWGTTDAEMIAAKVYDKVDDAEIGEAQISPAKREIPNAGVAGLDIQLNWKFETGGFVDSSPAVSGGKVYFGSWDKNFYCVDQQTGELIWKFETGDCVDSSPAVSDGKVYFGSWDRNVYCLDAATGKELWRYKMEPSEFDDHRQSSPLVVKSSVFMGGFNGNVYCFKAEDGKLVWKHGLNGPIRSRPDFTSVDVPRRGKNKGVYHDKADMVSVGAGDGKLHVLRISGPDFGKVSEWAKFTAGGPVHSSPAVTGYGVSYFGSEDGKVYCVYNLTGKNIWSFQTGGRIEYSSPLLVGNAVLIGSTDGKQYALDMKTGQPLWASDTGGVIYSSPQAAKGMIVIANNDGAVYWLDARTGTQKAVFHAKDAVQGLSSAPDGAVYAGSRDGYLYCLSAGK